MKDQEIQYSIIYAYCLEHTSWMFRRHYLTISRELIPQHVGVVLNRLGINYGGMHLCFFIIMHGMNNIKLKNFGIYSKGGKKLRNRFGCDGDSFCIQVYYIHTYLAINKTHYLSFYSYTCASPYEQRCQLYNKLIVNG